MPAKRKADVVKHLTQRERRCLVLLLKREIDEARKKSKEFHLANGGRGVWDSVCAFEAANVMESILRKVRLTITRTNR